MAADDRTLTLPSIRWSGAFLLLAGASFAAFVLVHPFDQLAGAEAMLDPRWMPAHTFHFLGALFAVAGLPGLYVRHLSRTGWAGHVGFLLALGGAVMFAGTGMITAYLWPMMAEHAPGLVAGDGAVFTDRLSAWVTAAPYALMVPGYALLAVMLLRARAIPLAAGVLIIAGIVLFAAPVEPVGSAPWVLRVAGGVLFGGGLGWVGFALWSEVRPISEEPAAAGSR